MRIFVAGATGVLGIRLVPLLVRAGHDVTGMTRSADKADRLREVGAESIVCDVFDADALGRSLSASSPDVVIDELTDLPDAASELSRFRQRNDRIRTEGTRNLVTAANGARLISQSIAWQHPDPVARAAVEEHERLVVSVGGTILRYGQLYGIGTFYPDEPPPAPRIHVDEAARRTVDALDSPPGVHVVIDES
jgi:uncharacterized protein YbjT (DUF2867 family)